MFFGCLASSPFFCTLWKGCPSVVSCWVEDWWWSSLCCSFLYTCCGGLLAPVRFLHLLVPLYTLSFVFLLCSIREDCKRGVMLCYCVVDSIRSVVVICNGLVLYLCWKYVMWFQHLCSWYLILISKVKRLMIYGFWFSISFSLSSTFVQE